MNRIPMGLSLLPRHQLRPKLQRDIQHWLAKGNRITELPPNRARGLYHYDTMRDFMLETGLRCEY